MHFFFSFLLTNIFKLASVKYFYEVEETDTRQDGTIVLFETCRHLSDDIQKKYTDGYYRNTYATIGITIQKIPLTATLREQTGGYIEGVSKCKF